jgi:tetratricopeptide (TPR) repeat protein
MEGRGELALRTARESAARAKGESEFAELSRSRPILTLLRLERWNDVLAEPPVGGTKGLAALLDDATRGVALARTGQVAQAAEALKRIEAPAAKLIDAHAGADYRDRMLRGVVSVSRQRLRAEVALAEGRSDAAVDDQRQALALAKDIDDTEPPLLAAGTRLALGDLQLRTHRWAEAEQTFRTDLAEHPKSGWARRGLVLALRAQGRAAEAEAIRAELRRDWPSADPLLLAGL